MQKADVNLEIVVSPEHSNDVLNDNSEMNPKNELAEKKEEQSDESATSADENDDDDAVKIGPGRPRITRTGLRGRPRKEYNVLNMMRDSSIQIPVTVGEAMAVVELPKGEKAIGCKWVFTLKRNSEGDIERYKARLVAKGCSQKFGIDYEETYSPVVRYATIRMVLAMAAEHELHVHQLDVSTAYLNGDLEETVYMKQPEQFDDGSGSVLKLKKSLQYASCHSEM
ncbi:hypothetical protein ACLKA6_017529 [Drosophila palustris]